MATKKNPHIGRTLAEHIRERAAKDPEFSESFRTELDQLQIARRVRALREKRHLSQAELAERVGTKQPAIARLESGKTVPHLDLLERIAHALGMRLDLRFVAEKG